MRYNFVATEVRTLDLSFCDMKGLTIAIIAPMYLGW